ncbi:rCG52597 [Rattus norvegicus]|uniref:RCG52597 n=1 Tax=Rattus norvegicus TaxID=10116 RepID=A6IQT4_RAT|nr:rCG52597 [Rattus norvegicus]
MLCLHLSTAEAKDLKTNCMKMMEVLEQETNKSLQEIQRNKINVRK